jgi:hypothetical protein
MIFNASPQFGQCSMSKTRLSSRGPTHVRRFSLTLGVIVRGFGGTLCFEILTKLCLASQQHPLFPILPLADF